MSSAQGRIVVGVDGSEASSDAVRWAIQQAKLTHSELEMVTGWHFPDQYSEWVVPEKVDWRARAESLLDDALTGVDHEGVTIIRTMVEGHPAAILTQASLKADLLVVGSRGHGGFAGMLLGSVSTHVSAHAHCPVVVIRHHDS